MKMLRYPIGLQYFPGLIEDGYTYIDKTAFIKPLLEQGKYLFLSRPRRFGKSLLLSTLEAYFEGRRELFRGLAADTDDLDWTPSPVLHFDFNNGLYEKPVGLLVKIDNDLRIYEERFGLPAGSAERESVSQRCRNLIESAFRQTGRKVVVLVDEYDKPLLGMEEAPETFRENQSLLKSFYSNLKTLDRCIRFVLITGVARFAKVSIFSDFNNLDDISLDDRFADICGWTEEEVTGTFRSGIEALAEYNGDDFETTLKALREYYDGYLFAPRGSRLYNPFSVLRALKGRRIDPYWFITGTPTFLVKRFKAKGIYPPDLDRMVCSRKDLTTVGMDDSNPLPLMFQTGYLTIDSYSREAGAYRLRFPNREVEIGFYEDLVQVYAPATESGSGAFDFVNFRLDLVEGRPDDFMARLAALLKDLPGEDHCESVYRAVTYLLAVLSGTRAVAEHHGYLGRSDIEVQTGGWIYIFEFKYNKSVRDAMEQIHSRDYAGRFEKDPRQVYLIGANFNERKEARGLQYEIELLG